MDISHVHKAKRTDSGKQYLGRVPRKISQRFKWFFWGMIYAEFAPTKAMRENEKASRYEGKTRRRFPLPSSFFSSQALLYSKWNKEHTHFSTSLGAQTIHNSFGSIAILIDTGKNERYGRETPAKVWS